MQLPKFIRKNLRSIVVLLVVAIVIFTFVNRGSSQNQTKKAASVKVVRGDLKETLTLSGSINADERVVLRFQTGGKLAYVGVDQGNYVRKGQLIASLDQREVKKNLQKRLNFYKKTRWDFEQLKDDDKNLVITDAIKRTFEKTQFDLDNSVLDVELQQLAVEFSNLYSPINGIVTAVTAPIAGVNISPTDAQFEITNPKTIYFSANADQTEVATLHSGIAGELVLDSYPDVKIPATIDRIAFTPTQGETGTVYAVVIKVKANNKDFNYRIGMTGDVTFTTKVKKKSLYVPVQFVTEQNGKKFVTIKKNETPVQKEVTTGFETDNFIEIKSGINEGDTVYD